MAKKDFTKNNPALAFITTGEEEPQTPQPTAKKPATKKATAKKTTKSQETAKEEPTTKTPGKPPKGYKINPEFIELKSQRLNLLLQPSVVKRVKKMAKSKKLSVNETISQILIENLEREGF